MLRAPVPGRRDLQDGLPQLYIVLGISLLTWPDIASVAESLGARAITVRKVEEFDQVRGVTGNLDGPVVVVVKLDPTVNIIP